MSVSWQLFVDESGQFDRADDEVVVAGLLAREDVARRSLANLRAVLTVAGGNLPWPLHASLLNLPIYTVLVRQASPDIEDTMELSPSDWTVAAQEAIVILERREPQLLKKALAAIGGAHELKFDLAKQLDRKVRSANEQVHRILELRVKWILERLRTVIVTLNEETRDDGGVLWLFPSGEAGIRQLGDVLDGSGMNRYVSTLTSLLSRVAKVLRRGGNSHHVVLRVLARTSAHPTSPGRRTHLQLADVEKAALAALRDTTDVEFSVAPLSDFDSNVDPALVLADFCANRTYRTLSDSRDRGLRQVEDLLRARIGAGVRSGRPSRTHVSATGIGAGVDDAAAGLISLKPWAVEQHDEWHSARATL